MISSATDRIKNLQVFAGMREEQQEMVLQAAIHQRYEEREFIVHAGDAWPYLFLVVEGSVCALKESSEGRSLKVTEVGTGELFWGLAFFEEEMTNPVSLQANQPSTIYLWNRKSLLPVLLENGNSIWELSRLMVLRMFQASEVINGLAFQPVAGRLARLLIEFPRGVVTGPIARSITLDEMAARIGSTREVVCRFLQRFSDSGLIKITRTEYEITDREGLKEMAKKVKP